MQDSPQNCVCNFFWDTLYMLYDILVNIQFDMSKHLYFPSSTFRQNDRCSWMKLINYQISIFFLTHTHKHKIHQRDDDEWCLCCCLIHVWQEFSKSGFLELLCISLQYLHINDRHFKFSSQQVVSSQIYLVQYSMTDISSLVIKGGLLTNIFCSILMTYISSLDINKQSAHQCILFNIRWHIFQV